MNNHLYLLLFLLFISAGCSPLLPASRSFQQLPESKEVIAKYLERPSITTVQGMAKIRLFRSGKWKGGSHVLKLSSPGSVYAETLSLFGQTLAITTSDGEMFSLFIPGEKRLYYGVAEAERLKKVFAVELSSEELVSLLLYDVGITGNESFDEIKLNNDGLTSFYYNLPEGSRVVTFDGDRNLVQYKIDNKIQVNYTDFADSADNVSGNMSENISDDQFPRKVEIRGLTEDVALQVTYTDIDFNITINQADFTMQVPGGTELVPLLD